jgi:hypothetical protein
MNTFKKKSLYAALAGASALGVTGAAQAVNVNPDGLGQVLIYPYYTTQDKVQGAAFSSLLSVVNSTASVKAVKVRFLEGKNSQEVLDFNLFLSPKDVWTAAILASGAGAGVATFDKSCTVPVVSNNALAPSLFVNYLFSDSLDDLAGAGLDRTKEGYVEIIEMGVPTDPGVVKSITHVAGVPPCTGLTTLTGTPMAAPNGGLFGGMTLINVLAGEDYTEDAIALENFRTSGKYDDPGSVKPDLADVSTNALVIGGSTSAVIVESQIGARPIDMISALFMHDHVYNEFVLDTGTKSGTDWVVTMPTKRYYYTRVTGVAGVSYAVEKLFQRNFGADGACDDILLNLFDREEAVQKVDVGFSPPKPGAKANTLCWEANVLTFTFPGSGSNVLGSKNSRTIASPYVNGWGDLQFPLISGSPLVHQLFLPSTTITSLSGTRTTGTATYLGLPVVGFAAISFQNGTLTAPGTLGLIQSQYGGNFVHKTKRTVGF